MDSQERIKVSSITDEEIKWSEDGIMEEGNTEEITESEYQKQLAIAIKESKEIYKMHQVADSLGMLFLLTIIH